ncbi:MAG: hypothetical protein NVV72_20240 [Asticcacaulis sp.]|nr:hypothetical protein [Asticcacaulis sp.]
MQNLPEGWLLVTDEGPHLVAELRREMMAKHALYRDSVEAVARKNGHDDTLFRLSGDRYAQVHLTYQVETTPQWPMTTIFDTYQNWLDDLAANETK